MKELFNTAFGLDTETMELNHPYLVEEANVGIKSLDDNNNIIFSKIIRAIKKSKRRMFKITLEDNTIIRVARDHVFAVKKDNDFIWVTTQDIYDLRKQNEFYLLSEILPVKITKIVRDGSDYPLDIEVDNTHNYFSNGILSHNSLYGPSYKAAFSGKAVEFYSSWIARMNRVEDIKGKKELEGIRTKIRVEKSKIGINKREAIIDLYFDHGIDSEADFMNYLKDLGIVEQRGAYFYNEDWGMKVQGKQGLADFLDEHPDIKEKAKEQVNTLLAGHTILDNENEDEEEDNEEDLNFNPETGEITE